MTDTTAGRALLADPTMLTDDGEEAAEDAIDAIEREAKQQERERIRPYAQHTWDCVVERAKSQGATEKWTCVCGLDAILAEPSDE